MPVTVRSTAARSGRPACHPRPHRGLNRQKGLIAVPPRECLLASASTVKHCRRLRVIKLPAATNPATMLDLFICSSWQYKMPRPGDRPSKCHGVDHGQRDARAKSFGPGQSDCATNHPRDRQQVVGNQAAGEPVRAKLIAIKNRRDRQQPNECCSHREEEKCGEQSAASDCFHADDWGFVLWFCHFHTRAESKAA